MSTEALDFSDWDTQGVARPQLAPFQRRVRSAPLKLSEMDLEPPEGPVPADVISYFEDALRRERARGR
jgi:hypothetical protein